jgi:hypothetical protein
MWIVQEFVTARDRLILCGNDRLFLNPGLSIYSNYSFKVLTDYNWGQKAQLAIDMTFTDDVMELSEAITQFHDRKCLDPRDKVFGLLGITRSCH